MFYDREKEPRESNFIGHFAFNGFREKKAVEGICKCASICFATAKLSNEQSSLQAAGPFWSVSNLKAPFKRSLKCKIYTFEFK